MKLDLGMVNVEEPVQVDGLDALLEAGRKLRQLDPARFERLLSLARTYVSIYERPGEHEEVFLSRMRQLTGTQKPSA